MNDNIFDMPEQLSMFGETKKDVAEQGLCERYIIPPFSVFDTKQTYWQDRKRLWLDLGIKSELGRDAKTFHMADWANEKRKTGSLSGNNLPSDTSIFDPVLCEICYSWFCPKGGVVLDPFSGGSVRGIVAKHIGLDYLGIDLRKEQIEANKENAKEIFGDNITGLTWINDDSMNVGQYIDDESVDFIFSCPPYFDLEVYSDLPNDLSNMEIEDFISAYTEIIYRCMKKLKQDRFACFVVGDVRDKRGFYRNFIDITKSAFITGGGQTWNEIILLNSLASAPLRAAAPFQNNRKLCKVHQNVLVFYKGNPKNIKSVFEEE